MSLLDADIQAVRQLIDDAQLEEAAEKARLLWKFDSANIEVIRLWSDILVRKGEWQNLNGVTRRALYFAPGDPQLRALRQETLTRLNRPGQWTQEQAVQAHADDWQAKDRGYLSHETDTCIAPKGVLYIAMDAKYVEEAAFSAQSFKRHHPDIPVCLLTTIVDHPFAHRFDDVLTIPKDYFLSYYFDKPGRYASVKAYCLRMSPYRQTLYLDTDTYVLKPIDAVFDKLDKVDFVFFEICNVKFGQQEGAPHIYARGLNCPYVADTGVLAFRKSSRMDHFFDLWLKRFMETTMGTNRFAGNWGKGLNDQATLNKMIGENIFLECGVQAGILPGWQYDCKVFCLDMVIETGLLDQVRLLHINGMYDRFKGQTEFDVAALATNIPREQYRFPLVTPPHSWGVPL